MIQVLLIAAGGLFVIACALAAGLLIAPRTTLPLPVRFMSGAVLTATGIFLLLTIHAGFLLVWLLSGAALIATAALRFRRITIATLPGMPWYFRVLFACYGAIYLLYALAPEIQADAVTYHLGLVFDYVRLHAFSNRVEFYSLLPQGVEMLFVPAFAIGAHSAAKLVHFSFLIATVSLLRHIGRELGVSDLKTCCAAALFFLAPVVAITATSAYTDMALVCSVCAVLYLMLRWNRERTAALLLLAGLNAGFCYSIKPTFGWVAIIALAYVVRAGGKAGAFIFPAAIGILPWMIRAAVLTGDPAAPFLSEWFPNGATTPAIEAELFRTYSAFRSSFSWHSAILDYTIRGGNQGILGPAFLLLPLSLLALRKSSFRWLVAASLLLAVPILANTGTRFLMPAVATASIALVSILPAPAALALVGFQMIGTASPMLKSDWRLPEIPWRAALRIEPETHYLQRMLPDFANDVLIANSTPPKAKIFALASIHQAYIPREVLVYWQSARADQFVDSLRFSYQSSDTPAQLLSWRWPAGAYRMFRVSTASDLRIVEEQLDAGLNSTRAIPLKLLGAGDRLDFRAPPGATGADLVIWPADRNMTSLQAQSKSGKWQLLDGAVLRDSVPLDLRRSVTSYIRRSGYRYILVSLEKPGAFSEIGQDMLDHPNDWGLKPAASNGAVWLFYIS